MHTGAVDALLGLGHKGGVKAVALGNGLGRHLEGHDIVRRAQHVLVLEIDLVLGRGDLMVGGFHLESHVLQIQHNVPAHVLRQVDGRHVEIPGRLVGLGGGTALLVGVEQEKLALRSNVEHVPHLLRPLHGALQHIARVPDKGLLIHAVHVADQARHLALLRPPGEYLKGVQVGIQVHVGLVDPHKALDGGAVEHAAVVQRFLKLAGRDSHIFQHSEDIRKLQTDEFHILLLRKADYIFLTVFAHCFLPFSSETSETRPPCSRQHGPVIPAVRSFAMMISFYSFSKEYQQLFYLSMRFPALFLHFFT